MAILLSSANSTVVMRWAGLLNGHFETEKAQSLGELKTLCATRKFDAILLHRMLIDMPAFPGLLNIVTRSQIFSSLGHARMKRRPCPFSKWELWDTEILISRRHD